MEAPLQILWRKKKEGENFEEEEEGMRGGRRKKEKSPPALDLGSAAVCGCRSRNVVSII